MSALQNEPPTGRQALGRLLNHQEGRNAMSNESAEQFVTLSVSSLESAEKSQRKSRAPRRTAPKLIRKEAANVPSMPGILPTRRRSIFLTEEAPEKISTRKPKRTSKTKHSVGKPPISGPSEQPKMKGEGVFVPSPAFAEHRRQSEMINPETTAVFRRIEIDPDADHSSPELLNYQNRRRITSETGDIPGVTFDGSKMIDGDDPSTNELTSPMQNLAGNGGNVAAISPMPSPPHSPSPYCKQKANLRGEKLEKDAHFQVQQLRKRTRQQLGLLLYKFYKSHLRIEDYLKSWHEHAEAAIQHAEIELSTGRSVVLLPQVEDALKALKEQSIRDDERTAEDTARGKDPNTKGCQTRDSVNGRWYAPQTAHYARSTMKKQIKFQNMEEYSEDDPTSTSNSNSMAKIGGPKRTLKKSMSTAVIGFGNVNAADVDVGGFGGARYTYTSPSAPMTTRAMQTDSSQLFVDTSDACVGTDSTSGSGSGRKKRRGKKHHPSHSHSQSHLHPLQRSVMRSKSMKHITPPSLTDSDSGSGSDSENSDTSDGSKHPMTSIGCQTEPIGRTSSARLGPRRGTQSQKAIASLLNEKASQTVADVIVGSPDRDILDPIVPGSDKALAPLVGTGGGAGDGELPQSENDGGDVKGQPRFVVEDIDGEGGGGRRGGGDGEGEGEGDDDDDDFMIILTSPVSDALDDANNGTEVQTAEAEAEAEDDDDDSKMRQVDYTIDIPPLDLAKVERLCCLGIDGLSPPTDADNVMYRYSPLTDDEDQDQDQTRDGQEDREDDTDRASDMRTATLPPMSPMSPLFSQQRSAYANRRRGSGNTPRSILAARRQSMPMSMPMAPDGRPGSMPYQQMLSDRRQSLAPGFRQRGSPIEQAYQQQAPLSPLFGTVRIVKQKIRPDSNVSAMASGAAGAEIGVMSIGNLSGALMIEGMRAPMRQQVPAHMGSRRHPQRMRQVLPAVSSRDASPYPDSGGSVTGGGDDLLVRFLHKMNVDKKDRGDRDRDRDIDGNRSYRSMSPGQSSESETLTEEDTDVDFEGEVDAIKQLLETYDIISGKDQAESHLEPQKGGKGLSSSKSWLFQSQSSIGSDMMPIIPSRSPPLGEITLVFTDIQSSTALWEHNPIHMATALDMHNETLREFLPTHNGYEVKTEGDGFMVAFDTPSEGLRWCLDVQEGLLKKEWPEEMMDNPAAAKSTAAQGRSAWEQKQKEKTDGSPAAVSSTDDVLVVDDGKDWIDQEALFDIVTFRGPKVRMGVHVGSPTAKQDPTSGRMDYFGPVVNRAARVSGAAHGGQILLSSSAWQAILEKNADLVRSIFYRVLGREFRLKGLEATVETLVEVLPLSLRWRWPSFPPPRIGPQLPSAAIEGRPTSATVSAAGSESERSRRTDSPSRTGPQTQRPHDTPLPSSPPVQRPSSASQSQSQAQAQQARLIRLDEQAQQAQIVKLRRQLEEATTALRRIFKEKDMLSTKNTELRSQLQGTMSKLQKQAKTAELRVKTLTSALKSTEEVSAKASKQMRKLERERNILRTEVKAMTRSVAEAHRLKGTGIGRSLTPSVRGSVPVPVPQPSDSDSDSTRKEKTAVSYDGTVALYPAKRRYSITAMDDHSKLLLNADLKRRGMWDRHTASQTADTQAYTMFAHSRSRSESMRDPSTSTSPTTGVGTRSRAESQGSPASRRLGAAVLAARAVSRFKQGKSGGITVSGISAASASATTTATPKRKGPHKRRVKKSKKSASNAPDQSIGTLEGMSGAHVPAVAKHRRRMVRSYSLTPDAIAEIRAGLFNEDSSSSSSEDEVDEDGSGEAPVPTHFAHGRVPSRKSIGSLKRQTQFQAQLLTQFRKKVESEVGAAEGATEGAEPQSSPAAAATGGSDAFRSVISPPPAGMGIGNVKSGSRPNSPMTTTVAGSPEDKQRRGKKLRSVERVNRGGRRRANSFASIESTALSRIKKSAGAGGIGITGTGTAPSPSPLVQGASAGGAGTRPRSNSGASFAPRRRGTGLVLSKSKLKEKEKEMEVDSDASIGGHRVARSTTLDSTGMNMKLGFHRSQSQSQSQQSLSVQGPRIRLSASIDARSIEPSPLRLTTSSSDAFSEVIGEGDDLMAQHVHSASDVYDEPEHDQEHDHDQISIDVPSINYNPAFPKRSLPVRTGQSPSVIAGPGAGTGTTTTTGVASYTGGVGSRSSSRKKERVKKKGETRRANTMTMPAGRFQSALSSAKGSFPGRGAAQRDRDRDRDRGSTVSGSASGHSTSGGAPTPLSISTNAPPSPMSIVLSSPLSSPPGGGGVTQQHPGPFA